MARTRKVIQQLNLQKYNVLIDDVGSRSDYFKITQFDGYFYGGRNAFLIAGTTILRTNSRILIEILNVNGETVYSTPVINFAEANSRLIQVEVYSDTPPGPGKIIVLGVADTYLDGSPIPEEWSNKYNVRWVTDVIISPKINNKTPIRFLNTPVMSVVEKFYPTPATASFSQSVNLENSSYDFSPVTFNIFQNGYLIKLKNSNTNNVFKSEYDNGNLIISASISNSGELIVDKLPITKIFNDSTVESRGKVLTSNLGTSISKLFVSSSTAKYDANWQPYGTITIQSSSINLQYNKIIESSASSSNVSFAKLKISNLNTISGEINKIRVSYKETTSPGDYKSLGYVFTQVENILSRDSGSKIINLGKFNTINFSDYWYAATMSVARTDDFPVVPAIYLSSSLYNNLNIIQSSKILLDAIYTTPELNGATFKNNVSYFIGTKNVVDIELFPNSEYTLKFDATVSNVSESVQLSQTDYSMEVYLIQQETSNGKILTKDSRGQLIGTLTPSTTFKKQFFENTEFNFTPKIITSGKFALRFVVYGGFWNIANVTLKVAEEEFFSPDEVSILIPNIEFSKKLLTFKAEYLDINNNSTDVITISNPTYFTGSAASSQTATSNSSSYAATASNLVGGIANYIPVWTSATVQSSSNIYQDATGKIGIGITSSAAALHISSSTTTVFQGETSTSPILKLVSTNGFGQTVVGFTSASTGIGYIGTISAADFQIRTNGTYKIFVQDSTANVGIGTNSPATKLQIQGNVSASSYTSSILNSIGFLGTASSAVSSSFAITSSYIIPSGLPVGTVSSSGQVSYTELANIPVGILSSSTQINNLTGVSASYANNADLLDGLNSTIFATTGSNTFVGNQVVTGSLSITGSTYIRPIIENVLLTASAPPTTLNYNVVDSAILFHSGSTGANWTLNFRGNASTTLNSIMPLNSSVTVTLLTQNGSTAYSASAYQIDGSSIIPKWQGGTSGSGNTNSIDAHTFTIIKISSTPTYLLLGSITRYS